MRCWFIRRRPCSRFAGISWSSPRRTGLPTISYIREMAVAGALVTYGPDAAHDTRLAAGYVDKILKGAKPADLPVMQPREV
jgi:ABC-type uncharacterized transport system substrate-binding protein